MQDAKKANKIHSIIAKAVTENRVKSKRLFLVGVGPGSSEYLTDLAKDVIRKRSPLSLLLGFGVLLRLSILTTFVYFSFLK